MNQGFQTFLRHWFQTPPGLVVYKQEKKLVDKALNRVFGYFLVQLGCVSNENLVANSRVVTKLLVDKKLSDLPAQSKDVNWIQAELDFLPIARDKVDVVFLPHTLETIDDPYYLLRQVDTMLVPEGHIVLTGFNPYACIPFRLKYFSSLTSFNKANFHRASRLKEWLEVLGYEVTLVEHSSVMCFTNNGKYKVWTKIIEKVEESLKGIGLDFGNVYCLVAKKKVDAPTLVGLKWHLPKWRGVKNGVSVSRESTSRQSKSRQSNKSSL
ncbi:bifunctional 2-polyprenyl-6-hydroxyphenol methylase/3-demethylubiquinol 3-O-methyltransferase UbiG [Thiomicrorhabdus sp. Milos-T2]|uniref:class I SAM-dependent methyltransferase n=1 Tax=Thiomicrorhabdus sp. Milos-T2 TaxID=90814 RepID=UPI00068FB38D|nr:methyltransferase domain-containing protein [Thiomicrorhabdus sp. Milos-T2]